MLRTTAGEKLSGIWPIAAERLHDDDRPAVVRQGGGSGRQGIVRRQPADAVERRRGRRDNRRRSRGTDPPGAAPLQSRRARADRRGAFARVLRAFGLLGRGDHLNRSRSLLERGDIAPERNSDADRVVGALAGVVGLQRTAQAPGLDAHDRVGLRVEIVGPAERLRRDGVALDRRRLAGKRLLDDEGQEGDEPRRVPEGLARDDAREGGAEGLDLVGGIDALRRLGETTGRHYVS